jgi:hypothetical protein
MARNPRWRSLGAGERRYWALLANPNLYRIEDAVRDLEEDTWTTASRPIHAGDRLVIWKAKGRQDRRGVIALGQVTSGPFMARDDDNPYWIVPPTHVEERVRVRYVLPPCLPLWYEDHGPPALASLSVSRATGGHVFNVTPEQWDTLVAAAGGWPDARS